VKSNFIFCLLLRKHKLSPFFTLSSVFFLSLSLSLSLFGECERSRKRRFNQDFIGLESFNLWITCQTVRVASIYYRHLLPFSFSCRKCRNPFFMGGLNNSEKVNFNRTVVLKKQDNHVISHPANECDRDLI